MPFDVEQDSRECFPAVPIFDSQHFQTLTDRKNIHIQSFFMRYKAVSQHVMTRAYIFSAVNNNLAKDLQSDTQVSKMNLFRSEIYSFSNFVVNPTIS